MTRWMTCGCLPVLAVRAVQDQRNYGVIINYW
jgi:hypothetical protein